MNQRAFLPFAVFVSLCCGPAVLPATGHAANSPLHMMTPQPNAEIIAKHADLQAVFTEAVEPSSLLIILDDTDISVTAEITEQGFHCKVLDVLPAGKHLLYVAGKSVSGDFETEVAFSSRQYAGLDEAYSSNEWSTTVKVGNHHRNKEDDFTSSAIDSTLVHESVIKKGHLQISLNAGARLLAEDIAGGGERAEVGEDTEADQSDAYGPPEQSSETVASNEGSLDPEQQGLDLNTVLMRAAYEKKNVSSAVEIGDLQIVGTQNTFETLDRNGGQIMVDLDKVYLNGFSVFGKDTFGVKDGIGLGFDDDDHLYGFSGGIRLFDHRLNLKGFYLQGGQSENAYDSWSQEVGNKGEVYGFVLTTDFFDKKMMTEIEYDHADYDPDSSDTFVGTTDEAYRIQVSGQQDLYFYDVRYEYFGKDYDIPGNLSPKKDYAGLTVNGSFQLGDHTIGLMASAYHDNVDADPFYARTNSYAGQLDYSFTGFTSYPLGMSYQHTTDISTDEPVDAQEIKLHTDTLSVNVGYAGAGAWSVDLTSSYSWQNDDSEQDADISTLSFAVSPTLSLDTFNLTMSAALNQNRDLLANSRTDDIVLTLDGGGSLFNELLTYEFGGSYDHSLITDNSGDRHGFTGYGRMAYNLPWLQESAPTALGVELQYNSDKPQETSTTEETVVFVTLSTSLPFSF